MRERRPDPRQGLQVDCLPAPVVRDVTRYDAFVVGGALYAYRWIREARRFVMRHRSALRARLVWMFSSGPLDDSVARPPRGLLATLCLVTGITAHVSALADACCDGGQCHDPQGGWWPVS